MDWDRAILIVLDGVGIGEAPDAHKYGDEGSNTLVNTARSVGGLHLPHLAGLGLGLLADIPGVPKVAEGPRRLWDHARAFPGQGYDVGPLGDRRHHLGPGLSHLSQRLSA